MLRGLPRSTLFPYTTLFRSFHGRRSRCTVTASRPSEAPRSVAKRRTRNLELQASGVMDAGSRNDGDRKSTRLNSSHSQISYAVFCLKKKNTQNQNVSRKTQE